MSLGVFIDYKFAPSKKAVKEAVQRGDVSSIVLRNYSAFGGYDGGPLADAPDGSYGFVGPDPERSRKFYGTIVKKGDTYKVT